MICSLMMLAALAVAGEAASAQVPKDVQTREIEVLRRTIAEQQSNPGQIIRTPQTLAHSTNSAYAARHAELEQRYLEGKLTAKQYQKALEQLRQDERKGIAATVPRVETKAPPAATPTAAAAKTPPPASVPAKTVSTPAAAAAGAVTAQPTAQQKTVSDVESKLDEMLRLKAAREQAALTNANAATNAVPAKLQTKRQRLDAILRQYVNGQLSEADYNAQRAKIVAEPD